MNACLRPSEEVGGTLSSDLQVAWHHARWRSETVPAVLAYVIPGKRFDEYFYPPLELGSGVTFYARRQNLPGDWMEEPIFKSDPRVAIFG